jgi:hypothetical protein
VWLAIARQWFDPPAFERDPLPFVDGGWEAFDADQWARIQLDREEDDDNPPDRKEGPCPPCGYPVADPIDRGRAGGPVEPSTRQAGPRPGRALDRRQAGPR